MELRAPDALRFNRAWQSDQLFAPRFLIPARCCRPLIRPNAVAPGALDRRTGPRDDALRGLSAGGLERFQITIPELGLIKADKPPIVIITSTARREIHDAVKRRCLYHWVDFPSPRASCRSCVCACRRTGSPGAPDRRLHQGLRALDLYKLPGVAETIEWARALAGAERPAARSRDGAVDPWACS